MEPIFPVTRNRTFTVVSPFEAWQIEARGASRRVAVDAGDIIQITLGGFFLVRDQSRVPVVFDEPVDDEIVSRSNLYRPRLAPPAEALSEIDMPASSVRRDFVQPPR